MYPNVLQERSVENEIFKIYKFNLYFRALFICISLDFSFEVQGNCEYLIFLLKLWKHAQSEICLLPVHIKHVWWCAELGSIKLNSTLLAEVSVRQRTGKWRNGGIYSITLADWPNIDQSATEKFKQKVINYE